MFRGNPLGHCVVRPGAGPLAIPGGRTTPRPREPKPTPGTVAFPLAPLQCRSSIYTTSCVENPLALKNKVKGNQGADRCGHKALPIVRDRGPSDRCVRPNRPVRKSNTTVRPLPASMTVDPLSALPTRNLSQVSRREEPWLSGSQLCKAGNSLCKLWISLAQACRFLAHPGLIRESNVSWPAVIIAFPRPLTSEKPSVFCHAGRASGHGNFPESSDFERPRVSRLAE
jgi:hypothetical protein